VDVRRRPAVDHDVFISHSSANKRRAGKLVESLEAAGLSVWLDADDIRFGVLLGRQLQEAIRRSRALLLLWSDKARASPWVTVEWLSAIQLERFVLPGALDATPLPQCLSTTLYVDLRRPSTAVVDRLARQLRDVPSGGSQLTPFARGIEPELGDAIAGISRAQFAMLDLLVDDHARARSQQQHAADLLAIAQRRWPLDSDIVNLAGYQAKNDYLLEHWEAVQAGRWPAQDPRLVDSRDRFFECLSVDPRNPSALNGLANTLLFQREFDAAAFFNRSSIDAARAQGVRYDAAEQDAALIARFVRDPPH
jgi:hypothetical protein